jgi:REP element-mobilizing transposase RayT
MELSNGIPVGADLCVCPDLHRVVQWFKTMTTNEYIRGVKTKKWQSFRGKLWQRNYYEHIIRNKRSYQIISAYILKNPAKWTENQI